MPNVPDIKEVDLSIPTPSSAPTSLVPLSDDECLIQLARAVEHHDASRLEEVARLIGRLAVTIEYIVSANRKHLRRQRTQSPLRLAEVCTRDDAV